MSSTEITERSSTFTAQSERTKLQVEGKDYKNLDPAGVGNEYHANSLRARRIIEASES